MDYFEGMDLSVTQMALPEEPKWTEDPWNLDESEVTQGKLNLSHKLTDPTNAYTANEYLISKTITKLKKQPLMVTYLDLDCNNINDAQFEGLCGAFTKMQNCKSLWLNANQLTDISLLLLAEIIYNGALEKCEDLDITENNMTVKGYQTLCNVLNEGKMANLNSLYVDEAGHQILNGVTRNDHTIVF